MKKSLRPLGHSEEHTEGPTGSGSGKAKGDDSLHPQNVNRES